MDFNDVFLYVTIAMDCGQIQENIDAFLRNHLVSAIERYPAQGNFTIMTRTSTGSQETKIADLVHDTHSPTRHFTSLENYCLMDYNRLSPVYWRANVFLRAQMADSALEIFQDAFQFLADKASILSGVITLFTGGVGIVTLRVNIKNASLKELCQCARRDTIYQLGEQAREFLHKLNPGGQLVANRPGEIDLLQDVFLLTVVRDAGCAEAAILPFFSARDSRQEDLYSLNSGLDFRGQYIKPKLLQQFLEDDLSTRDDTFFSLNFRSALVVESLWKRKNFTEKRLPPGFTPNAVLSREEYNDLNYLIWLEILLYQRHLLNQSSQTLSDFTKSPMEEHDIFEMLTFHAKMSTLINSLQGSLTTIYETYQEWIDRGREIMGIEARYRLFNERIGRIDESIETKYNFEQITRQNRLSEVGVLLAKLGFFFCLMQVLRILCEACKERHIFSGLTEHEVTIYLAFFLVFVVYSLFSWRKLGKK